MFGSKAKPFKDQDYKKLRESCIKSGKLFEDPEFPLNRSVEWKRPGEIVPDPKLFVDGASADDFSQGSLGNCWFVAACASIAGEETLWKKIVPQVEKQDWAEKNPYAGIFHFRFFQLGDWYDVVIDDRLPVKNNKLLYCSSKCKNKFWSSLLEKAYAKLFGDYESLKSGNAKDALVDMMGGVGENLSLMDYKNDLNKKKELFKMLEEADSQKSLMSASITGAYSTEQKLDTGLIATHAYSITAVRDVVLGTGASAFFKREKIQMIRCRNPWGEKEWTGAWCDGADEWQKVGDKEKKQMGLTFGDDGQFWMSFDDFCSQFTDLDICHMINTSYFSLKKKWREAVMQGEWKKPNRSGGCFNHKDSCLLNPQFVFEMKEEEGEVLLSLEQADARILKQEQNKKNATIGLTICKADLNRKYRMHDSYEKVEISTFINTRSVFHRTKLKRGRYLVVPASFDPGHEGAFMLRVYTRKDSEAMVLEADGPAPGGCMGPKYKAATAVTMVKAEGLIKQDIRGGGDPYCVIRTDKQKIVTPHVEDNLNPNWNWRCTFYKRKAMADIMVEVWNRNLGRDELMGQFTIMAASDKYRKEDVQSFRMLGKGKQAQSYMPGVVKVKVKHYTDLSEA